jgi:hypothetical protein
MAPHQRGKFLDYGNFVTSLGSFVMFLFAFRCYPPGSSVWGYFGYVLELSA